MALEIYAYQCKKCGQLHYPYRMVCKKCGKNKHNEFDPVPLPKKGKLVTFTELYTLPGDFAVATLWLGIVQLENGVAVTGQLRLPKPKIGMNVIGQVEPVRKSEFGQNLGMVFYPAK
ncbi:MAG: zinc ribbon domain-containing protein [Kiritimatiellae bacterium]|nr:zinc ribbon domain-containing protein [Kiritimatiellia bacterium]MDD4735750.1 zinc ribbon domain-containing protein [Kiritimatiellia bacterium]